MSVVETLHLRQHNLYYKVVIINYMRFIVFYTMFKIITVDWE